MQGGGAESAACAQQSGLTSAAIDESSRVSAAHSQAHTRRAITVRSVPVVQALASALCGLPVMPPRIECPADFGPTAAITLAAGTHRYALITVDLSGCRKVTGLTPTRYWATSPAFKQVLQDAMKSR